MESAEAIAYSSTANLGPGFDILAIAHNAFHDRITASISDTNIEGGIRLHGMAEPLDPLRNTAGLAAYRLLKEMDIRDSIDLHIMKGVPAGYGLGSSGASAAASVAAIDRLFNLGLSPEKKVEFSMAGEVASSGTPHADNVAASIYGGFVVVESISPIKVRRIRISEEFSFITIIPDFRIHDKTRIARRLVPQAVSIQKYVENARYIAELTSGLITGDRELVRSGMNDAIVEEARKPLFPFYDAVKRIMIRNNAAGACLSGAGPSIMGVVDRDTNVRGIRKEAAEYLKSIGIESNIVISNLAGGTSSD